MAIVPVREGLIIEKTIFKVNQRLELIISRGTEFKHYSSRIEELTNQQMTIAMPMNKGRLVFLNQGEIFKGRLIVSGAVYGFTSTFLDKKLHPLPVWIVSVPRNVSRTQQRSFVRIAAMLPVVVSLVADEDEKIEPRQVMSKDISGGGILLVLQKPLTIGTKLQLDIDIPGMGKIATLGEVVRVDRPQTDRPLFWVAVRYLEINERLRSKIIKYIFSKQLEQRQKGV